MSGKPLISVVIPAHNPGEYLQEALESVFAQSYDALEVIVIDDGSTPALVLPKMAREGCQEKLKLLRNEEALGAGGARNCGLEVATGELVAFLDSDDAWPPNRLCPMVECLLGDDRLEVVYGDYRFWTSNCDNHFRPWQDFAEDAPTGELDAKGSGWVYGQLLFDAAIQTGAVLARKKLFNRVGGFTEDQPIGEDYSFWLKICREQAVAKVDGLVVLYRQHAGGVTRRRWRRNYEYEVISAAWAAGPGGNPQASMPTQEAMRKRFAQLCFGHAYRAFWAYEFKLANTWFTKSLKYYRGRWKTWAYWLISSIARPFGRDEEFE